jgi:hypothetical protein
MPAAAIITTDFITRSPVPPIQKTKTFEFKNTNNDTNNNLLTKMANSKTNNKPFSLKNLSVKSKI